jgi:hypothetical protein
MSASPIGASTGADTTTLPTNPFDSLASSTARASDARTAERGLQTAADIANPQPRSTATSATPTARASIAEVKAHLGQVLAKLTGGKVNSIEQVVYFQGARRVQLERSMNSALVASSGGRLTDWTRLLSAAGSKLLKRPVGSQRTGAAVPSGAGKEDPLSALAQVPIPGGGNLGDAARKVHNVVAQLPLPGLSVTPAQASQAGRAVYMPAARAVKQTVHTFGVAAPAPAPKKSLQRSLAEGFVDQVVLSKLEAVAKDFKRMQADPSRILRPIDQIKTWLESDPGGQWDRCMQGWKRILSQPPKEWPRVYKQLVSEGAEAQSLKAFGERVRTDANFRAELVGRGLGFLVEAYVGTKIMKSVTGAPVSGKLKRLPPSSRPVVAPPAKWTNPLAERVPEGSRIVSPRPKEIPNNRVPTGREMIRDKWSSSSRQPADPVPSARPVEVVGSIPVEARQVGPEVRLSRKVTTARSGNGVPSGQPTQTPQPGNGQLAAVPYPPIQGANKPEARVAPLPSSTARHPGESMHGYLERKGVKQSLSAEQQRAADKTRMRMSSTPADEPVPGSGSPKQSTEASGPIFKARRAALQRDLAATEVSALPRAVLQADSKLLSSLGRDELASLRARLAPRGVELAEGVPQTEASINALARLDTAALSGTILRTVGFDFAANALLKGNPTLMKAARGYAIRSLAAGQDPTRVVEDLKSLFVGKLNKKTGAVIAEPLWSTLNAAQALPQGAAAGGAAQRQAIDYALATYYQLARHGAISPADGVGQWVAAVLSYADTALAQRPAAPWPEARWSNLQQHLVYDVRLAMYKNRFTAGGQAGGVPTPYTWPGVGPTKLQQQAAAGTAPSYVRNPKIPMAKGERTAFSNPMYDRAFGGANIERKVIGIDITQLPGYRDITAFLRKRNMVLQDWDQGLATAGDGRTVRVQAELQRAVAAEPVGGGRYMQAQDRLQDFNNRFTSTDRVVLTRNPYDLMTISTGRGPKNCLTMQPTKPGTWSQTLAGGLTQGTLGIYIAKNTDPTLARSSANTMVNPYRAVTGSGDIILGGNYTFFGQSTAMPDGVVQQIADHMDATFNANAPPGHYHVDPDVYAERLTDIHWPP